MGNRNDSGLQTSQKTLGVWERKTGDRRLGQNQLFGSFRVNPGVRVLSQSDPTDDALAAIASILQKPAETPVEKPGEIEKPADRVAAGPEAARDEAVPAAPPPPELPEPSAALALGDDIYVKRGPGPLDAIRFKWTARPTGDGSYFVDETIGDNPRVMTTGPMPKELAFKFVDERERDAQRRFDALKNEMTGQAAGRHDPGL